jgi:phosphorylcholine metabolism protein LicD
MREPDSPVLTEKNLVNARKILFLVASLFESHGIQYHLEGGTLLGIVRDHDLLPWDYDVDISIPYDQLENVKKLRRQFLLKGYKLSIKRSKRGAGPIDVGDPYIIKVKPILDHILNWFISGYEKHFIVLDIFLKKEHEGYVYWEAKGKTMRVESKYYKSYDLIEFRNVNIRTPNFYKEYLTQKYGDWSVPIKEWDCSKNELTIVGK